MGCSLSEKDYNSSSCTVRVPCCVICTRPFIWAAGSLEVGSGLFWGAIYEGGAFLWVYPGFWKEREDRGSFAPFLWESNFCSGPELVNNYFELGKVGSGARGREKKCGAWITQDKQKGCWDDYGKKNELTKIGDRLTPWVYIIMGIGGAWGGNPGSLALMKSSPSL